MSGTRPGTSTSTGTADPAPDVAAPRSLRLRMHTRRTDHGVLDGAWWPYSTDLVAELPALVAGLDTWLDKQGPGAGGYISRIAVNPVGWDTVPTRVEVAGRRIRVAWYHSIDTHTVSVSCPDTRHFDLLVVPPGTVEGSASAAMTTAADGKNTRNGSQILGGPVRLVAPPRPRPASDPAPKDGRDAGGGAAGR